MRGQREYRPALDGLRALAVLAVVVYHAQSGTGGGYQGVTMFFVLSGYLITSLLMREYEQRGHIAIRRFYARRALRLVPALVLAVGVGGICALGSGWERKVITLRGCLYGLTYTTNIAQLFGDGFSIFVGHTWTLAIEEQFYLLWPFLVVVAMARMGARSRVAASVGLALVLLGARIVLAEYVGNVAARVAPPTDSVALAWGAAVAVVLSSFSRRESLKTARVGSLVWTVVCLASLVIVARFVPMQDGTGSESWGLVLSTAACSGLLLVALRPTLLQRLLATPALVWVGRRSYGIYLFDSPVQSLLSWNVHDRLLAGITSFVVTMILATVSYRFVETPFLRLKDRLRPEARPSVIPAARQA